ncbi:MAG TPA: sigma-70 family RNA polymerase sigma factor [Bryobacteraceae bacterium]|nr:sigma-70 family RNA polymerase sigma factor [Bryobacteraceae bacterium]
MFQATGQSPAQPAMRVLGAWESLTLESAFDQYHSLVFRVAYRMTGNAHDAEDVLQTVFLRLASRDAQSAGIENAESYLRRAAVHASLNLLELRCRKDVPLDGLPEPPGRGAETDLRQILRLAIGRLDRRSAEMFALRFIEGHSNPEIAELYGVSTMVVAVTLHRARRQLQKEIREMGGVR